MPLNLITDAWIPVQRSDGTKAIIAPHQIADPEITRPDWPRPDFNLACQEFLIGLFFLADPPEDLEDWRERKAPDMDRLQAALAHYSPAFNMTGDGPLFMQDLEKLEEAPKSVDSLFVDSAGEQTIKQNKDLMVTRRRETDLDLPLAAMALYTLQVFAPVGGAGIRAGLRGGGPLVTLIDPATSLWDLVWANVPYGGAGAIDSLPWMRKTRTSEKGSKTEFTVLNNGNGQHPEVFFSMPRRINLVTQADRVIGVRQRKLGTNYTNNIHPLTPYYMDKKAELLPQHPNNARLGYENWIGMLIPGADGQAGSMADCLRTWRERERRKTPKVIVAGWNMANATAVDFVESRPVLHTLDRDQEQHLRDMILAAKVVADSLGKLLSSAAGRKAYSDAGSKFYEATDPEMQTLYADLAACRPLPEIGADWHRAMRTAALSVFDQETLPVMSMNQVEKIGRVVNARKSLLGLFGEKGKKAQEIRVRLQIINQEA